MDTYTLLRAFADSWFLIFMFVFFVGCGSWAFWPSQRAARDEAASIPFKDSDCAKDCANCTCKNLLEGLENV